MSFDSNKVIQSSGRETGSGNATLMLGLAAQDPQALASLYDRYGRIVFTLADRILSDERESEEVTQDVFLAVWKNPGAYRPERASPLTWLAGITRNKCIDRMRKAGRRLPAHFEANEGSAVVADERAADPFRPDRAVENAVTFAVSIEVAGGRPRPEGEVVLAGTLVGG